LIVAKSFMNREFGKKLVQSFFPSIDLTHILDTSVAHIPGHGTPTAILMGRNRAPVAQVVRAVMGIKGEPSTPTDPAQGVVWNAIVRQIDQRGSESEWITVADVERSILSKHPWSMAGGGAAELKETIEEQAICPLNDRTKSIGITSFTLEDNAYIQERGFWERAGISPSHIRGMSVGDEVRDWVDQSRAAALFPYNADFTPIDIDACQPEFRFLWPFRTCLENSKMFGGETKVESGLLWHEYGRLTANKLKTPLSIAFSFVATHNHFVLDRGGKVFNRSSPIIKLPESANADEHLGLLGLLNSSTACFWLQQVCHNKGGPGGGSSKDEKWHDFFEHDASKVKKFPLVEGPPVSIARTLDRLARERSALLPSIFLSGRLPAVFEVSAARVEAENILRQMISWQEELDWFVYRLYGLTDASLVSEIIPPEIRVGTRAFEILMAKDYLSGRLQTRWFEWLKCTPCPDVPVNWPEEYKAVVQNRIAAIERSRDLRLIESMNCKRRWETEPWETLEKAALEEWLLNRLEARDLWQRDAHPAPKLRAVRELVDVLSGDEEFRRALDLYAGSGSDAHATVVALVQQASVPYLDALRYSESGLRKRAVWQNTWLMQRREDAIDAEVAQRLADAPMQVIKDEKRRRKSMEVCAIPVPPKYKQDDYRDGVSWKLRGALDVTKERFVSFPGLERSNDAGSPMLLWAGYDAKARALALTGYLYEMLQREGADAARLTPALAGLDELLPWVHQWHPEIDDDLGMSTGDYLQGLLDAQLAQHGLTLSAVRAWQPPAPVRRTRGRRASAAAQA